MTVKVYQPETNVLPLEIQNLGTGAGIEISLEPQNPAIFDSDIKDSIDEL